MSLQLFIELIHNLNKCFIHYETHVSIITLSHYLLIIMLFRINLMFIKLEDCFISIGPFIDTFQRLHESQTSLPFTQY
jgi:hypothetical protein